jgi:hypothetical protein
MLLQKYTDKALSKTISREVISITSPDPSIEECATVIPSSVQSKIN